MPNHITTFIRIHGTTEQVAEIRRRHWVSEGKDEGFSFDTLIPRPKSLDVTADFLITDLAKKDRSLEGIRDGKTNAEVEAGLTPERKKLLAQMRENVRDHGHPTWYEWSIKHWGTKWGAYDCTFDGSLIKFETAWSHPTPIMRKLFETYPDVRFEVQFADEDSGNNMGVYTSPNIAVFPKLRREGDEAEYARRFGVAYKILGRDIQDCRAEDAKDSEKYGEDPMFSDEHWGVAIKAFDSHKLP